MSKYDKTLDFVARCSVSSPSSSEVDGPPVGSLLVPLLAWPKGYLHQILGLLPTSQKQEENMSADEKAAAFMKVAVRLAV